MNNQPILSLCIPTYNRADVLGETLRLLLCDPGYDSNIMEIVVSDNASTDHTQQIAEKYPQVQYHRNESNIKDANFAVVLEMANGRYLKLINDTLRFESGQLKEMVEIIKNTDEETCNLLFFKSTFLHQNEQVEVRTKKELLRQATFYTTWTANFGIWKSDFNALTDKIRYVETQFLQVDWLYRNVDNGKPTKIVFGDFFDVVSLKNKGNYSIFDTFITKYLYVLKQHHIPLIAFKLEKYRLFRYFVMHWYFLLMKDKEYTFNRSGAKTIFKRYWYEPYSLPLFIIKYIRR